MDMTEDELKAKAQSRINKEITMSMLGGRREMIDLQGKPGRKGFQREGTWNLFA